MSKKQLQVSETVTVRIGERRATLQHVGEELNSVCPPECAAAAAELFARAEAQMRQYYPRPLKEDWVTLR